MNGDGRPDLVVANTCVSGSACGALTAGSVGVLLGNSDGTFQAALIYFTSSTEVSTVAVADVNGDGKPDILVGGACPNGDCINYGATVSVLLGNGDGTFQRGGSYNAVPSGAGSLAVADVNGDGKLDVLAAGGAVGVLLGNGDGTFQPEVSYSGGGDAADSVAVADVNGDGKLDLIVANQTMGNGTPNGGVGVLLGNGDGTFQPAVSYYSGGQYAYSVAVGDVNMDGRPDLLVVNYYVGNGNISDGSVGVLLGNGDGTFQSAVSYASGGSSSSSVAVGDVNGDGKLDLVVANECEGSGSSSSCANGVVSVLLGQGNGTFQPAVSYASGGAGARPIVIADVDGDAKPDLLATSSCAASNCTSSSGTVGVLRGNGDGTFHAAVIYASGGYYDDSVAVVDVNGDGKPDLLVATQCVSRTNCDPGGASVLLGNGNGTFRTAASYGSGGFYAHSLAVGDVNGDGKTDLLVANNCVSATNGANGTVGVLLGNGDGTFRTAVAYGSGGQSTYSVAVGDVNGDGKPHLVLANQCVASGNCANGTVGVLLGNGDGTFRTAIAYSSGGQYPTSVAVADVNGDGKPDLLVANYYAGNGSQNGSVSVLLGNGDGTFRSPVSYGSGGLGDSSVAVGDVNGDGKPDLLAANQCVNSNCANGALACSWATATAPSSQR